MVLSFHNCRWDARCQSLDPDPPNRMSLITPAGSLFIALSRAARTQAWLPVFGYLDSWWMISWHPIDRPKKIVE